MATNIYDYLTFGNTITFDVYPAAIIGARFSDVKVMALLDKDTAKQWIDPEAMHINVYPTLTDGVPDDPDQYQYVKLKHLNGKISVIGIPWIREDTLQTSQKGTLTISVKDVGPIDMDRIVKAISANGYRTDKVSLK